MFLFKCNIVDNIKRIDILRHWLSPPHPVQAVLKYPLLLLLLYHSLIKIQSRAYSCATN